MNGQRALFFLMGAILGFNYIEFRHRAHNRG